MRPKVSDLGAVGQGAVLLSGLRLGTCLYFRRIAESIAGRFSREDPRQRLHAVRPLLIAAFALPTMPRAHSIVTLPTANFPVKCER
jgi:hypothetical protein